MLHTMNLNDLPFNQIKSGTKRVEMRLYDQKRQLIKTNDDICFTNVTTGEKLNVKVTAIRVFKNFFELYSFYNDKTVLGYNKNERANPEDMGAYYSDENILLYGTCAIEIQL
ncbi:MAG: ASCH domain-containing protein [Clostridia bacterium]|nr:ASCH domain-containing protein [Clostridia bacterium]